MIDEKVNFENSPFHMLSTIQFLKKIIVKIGVEGIR